MQQPISLIIPTHYRHNFLKRGLEYYQASGIPIIIVDSTDVPFPEEELKKYNNIRYHHFPNMRFHKKMKAAFRMVDTEYVTFGADDDFIIPSSIYKCLQFLQENEDYSSSKGFFTGCKNTNGRLQLYPMYTNIKSEGDVTSDSPEVRLSEYLGHYNQHFYTVHRAESLKKAFERSSDEITNGNTTEIMLGAVSIMNGKHKSLPVFLGLREFIPASGGATTSGFHIIARAPEHVIEYSYFNSVLADELASVCHISRDSAMEKVEKAVDRYVETHSVPRKKAAPGLLKSMKDRIKIFIRNRVYSKLLSAFYMINADFTAISLLHTPGFPLNNAADRKELKTVLSLIRKHNIRSV